MVKKTHNIKIQVEDRKKPGAPVYASFMDSLSGMVYMCEGSYPWAMKSVSGGCLGLTGYPTSALVEDRKVSFRGLIIPDDKNYVNEKIRFAIKQRSPFEVVYRLRDINGNEKWVLEKGKGVYSVTGELESIEGFVTDEGCGSRKKN